MNAFVSVLQSVRRRPVVLPMALLATYVVVFVLVWSLVPLLVRWDIPVDNLEQLAWVLHPDWGYNKHPPFPTWVLWAFERAFPHSLPLTYALGGLEVAAMLFIAWRLTAETLDERRALLAVLLISCITYYTNRMHFYNHNTALLVAHAMATYCLWRGVCSGRAIWWALLGIAWGAGMLSKYQMLLSIGCNLIFLMLLAREPAWRSERVEFIKGLAISGLVCIAALLPHVVWLVRNDFPTFAYARHSVAADLQPLERLWSIASFYGNQFGRILPAGAAILLLLRMNRGTTADGIAAVSTAGHPPQLARPARLLLAVHAVGPLALMTLLASFAGMDLQMHWGTAYLWALIPWFLASRQGRNFAALPLHQICAIVLLVQVLTLAPHLAP